MKIRSHCVNVSEKFRTMGTNKTEELVFSSIQKHTYINPSYIFINTFSVSVFFKKLQINKKQRMFSATLMYVVLSTILSDALHQRVQKTLRMQTQIVSRKSLKYCITLKFHHLSRN